MIDQLATPAGMSFIKENGLGLRLEARVLAVTAREAEEKVRELGLLDPEVAWTELRQYHDRPENDVTGSGTKTKKHLPLWLVPPEIIVANAMRVVQTATGLSFPTRRPAPLALVTRAGVGAMAAVGRTHNDWRAYDGFKQKEPSWWVHHHELKRNVEAVTRRHNPSRRARKPAIVEERKDDIEGDVFADSREDETLALATTRLTRPCRAPVRWQTRPTDGARARPSWRRTWMCARDVSRDVISPALQEVNVFQEGPRTKKRAMSPRKDRSKDVFRAGGRRVHHLLPIPLQATLTNRAPCGSITTRTTRTGYAEAMMTSALVGGVYDNDDDGG